MTDEQPHNNAHNPTEIDGIEKLQLLRQLDDLKSASAVSQKKASLPDWKEVTARFEIPSDITRTLETLSSSPTQLLNSPASAAAAFLALRKITDDANAVQYLCDMILDACRTDTALWDKFAHMRDPEGIATQYCCSEAFQRNWRESNTNDSLAILLTGLQGYRHALKDPRKIYKLVADPTLKPLSPAGRLSAIANLLKDDTLRYDLCQSSTLRNIISQGFLSKQIDQTYQACICLWLLTFNDKVVAENGPLYIHRTLLRSFIEMLSESSRKEKVVRAAMYCLKNLLKVQWIFEIFFQKKIDHILTLLEYEKWRDQDLYDLIHDASLMVYSKVNQMSNFARYTKELDSGKFVAGPLHTEKFWVENVNKFEDNEFGPIQKLSKLIYTCLDPNTLSLALFDLGEFCRLHPTGKRVIVKTGAKVKIMELMNHPNKDVAREALLTTQKMMLEDWRTLGSEAQEKHQKITTSA